jgi:hypothetical protein
MNIRNYAERSQKEINAKEVLCCCSCGCVLLLKPEGRREKNVVLFGKRNSEEDEQ